MSKILDLKTKEIDLYTLSLTSPPTFLSYSPNKPTQIVLKEGALTTPSCISCYRKKCISYDADELFFPSKSIPHLITANVCPTLAINVNPHSNEVQIDKDLCINCGLCVSRCPIGAIYLTTSYAEVNNNHTDLKKCNKEEQQHFISHFTNNVSKKGIMMHENDDNIDSIFKKDIYKNLDNNQFKILIRNLFLELNLKAILPRIGDHSVRLTGLVANSTSLGIFEVESGNDTLSLTRNLLDGLATLHSRYNMNCKDIYPFSIVKNLPNNRSQYWLVVKDIKNVLDIKINTLSLGVLYILLWNFSYLDISSHDFYMDCSINSSRSTLESMINRPLTIISDNYSLLSPIK